MVVSNAGKRHYSDSFFLEMRKYLGDAENASLKFSWHTAQSSLPPPIQR
jgi:hypothetical protein